jgi:hypothetical protein
MQANRSESNTTRRNHNPPTSTPIESNPAHMHANRSHSKPTQHKLKPAANQSKPIQPLTTQPNPIQPSLIQGNPSQSNQTRPNPVQTSRSQSHPAQTKQTPTESNQIQLYPNQQNYNPAGFNTILANPTHGPIQANPNQSTLTRPSQIQPSRI